MALEITAGAAGSFGGMHCKIIETRADKPGTMIWGHNYGMVVNKEYTRLYDEGQNRFFRTVEMIALETWRNDHQSAFLMTDSTIMKRFRPGWIFDTTDTIPELVEKLGLHPAELDKTVSTFHAARNGDTFELMSLDGKRTRGLSPSKTNQANTIEKPPML